MDTSCFCRCVVQLSLFTKILLGHCFQFLLREIGNNGYAKFSAGKQARGRGLYSGFQVTGMIEGFLGLKFLFRYFFVGKLG